MAQRPTFLRRPAHRHPLQAVPVRRRLEAGLVSVEWAGLGAALAVGLSAAGVYLQGHGGDIGALFVHHMQSLVSAQQ